MCDQQAFSIIADECTDVLASKQMFIYLCFVDETQPCQPEVGEKFIGFIQLEYTDAELQIKYVKVS